MDLDCQETKICVAEDTTHKSYVEENFATMPWVAVPSTHDLYKRLQAGECNVLVGSLFELAELVVRKNLYNGEYTVSKIPWREPIALVTREDDRLWTRFVNVVLNSLFASERQGITQSDQWKSSFPHALAAVGNYGEIYDRNLSPLVPREQMNDGRASHCKADEVTGNTCLLRVGRSYPFGNLSVSAPDAEEGSTMHQIRKRGYLQCEEERAKASTSVLQCMKAEYCKAVGAALFGEGSGNAHVKYVKQEADYKIWPGSTTPSAEGTQEDDNLIRSGKSIDDESIVFGGIQP